MTTSASIPSTAAAYASACAWLPAEIEITPRPFSSSESVESLFRTPRGLNDTVRCRSSALKDTSAPTRSERVRELSSGVRCTRPAMRSRARWTSSSGRRSAAVATAADPTRSVLAALAAADEQEDVDGDEHEDPEVGLKSHVHRYGWAAASGFPPALRRRLRRRPQDVRASPARPSETADRCVGPERLRHCVLGPGAALRRR